VPAVPTFSFWFTSHDSFIWTFDRFPRIGEEITLAGLGVYLVLSLRDGKTDPTTDADYNIERVRETTTEDLQTAVSRGFNALPSL
jgi:hypothetical protein